MSFQAPHAGTFRMSLQIIFSDKTRANVKKFHILRELRGCATFTGSDVGSAYPIAPFPASYLDDEVTMSTEEEEVLHNSHDTGISVSGDHVVDFGIVGRKRLNGPFDTSLSSVTIDHAQGFPTVTFVEARIRSRDGNDSRQVTTHYCISFIDGHMSQQFQSNFQRLQPDHPRWYEKHSAD